ncbi:MAG: acyl-CoA dehydrogenase family protein [Myxococcota bacterium]|nr:acyl-CoA dehydrogenase family protein [Myxococcota bacterium]MDW8363149.1 acyl-CoA dehydrogenase family protein [Myxococcales bacterium]
MHGPYTEAHELFRAQVRTFAEKELRPHVDAWERDELFPRWVFERAGALGILGAHYPEDVGGGGGDFWFSVAKSEELPRCGASGVTMGLLVQSDMATPVIADLGTREQKEEFLRPALEGKRIAALGVSEPEAGSDVAAMRTVARKVGGDWVVRGSKTYITNGTRADFITLLVKTDPDAGHAGISILLFPTDVKGFSVGKKLPKAGNWSSDTAELFFDDCRVPERCLLGEPGRGFYYLMQNFQSERLIGCTSALAGSRYALERSVEYGRQRVAFGKPILKRDYWQQKFAELYTKYEAAHALTYRAADAYNREKYVARAGISLDTARLVSMAKAFVGDVTGEIIDQCLQFHGGMGYIEEGWVARAWRDQRLFRIGGGTTEVMRYAIAKLLGL